jgi:epoxyqueuosine reductase
MPGVRIIILLSRAQLKDMIADLQEKIGAINGRGFVDSAPVLERSWAQRSGLGWIGKNGNLITKGQGSFFFIATLITDLELEADDPDCKRFLRKLYPLYRCLSHTGYFAG